MFKLTDRRESEYCLGPTHEEEITQLVANEVSSYRQLPLRLYQIGKKFRNEARPRSGLLRAREFMMKDLYTFDTSEKAAMDTYDVVGKAYQRIFERIGIPFAVAEADTGAIGGSRSHEYHFLASVGEDNLLVCDSCGYTANEERATGHHIPTPSMPSQRKQIPLANLFRRLITDTLSGTALPNHHFSVHLATLGSHTSELVAVCHPTGTDINPIKISKTDFVKGRDLTSIDLSNLASLPPATKLLLLIDSSFETLPQSSAADVPSATETQYEEFAHFFEGAISASEVKTLRGDFLLTKEGDACPKCHPTPPEPHSDIKPLRSSKAIEVGHTFVLGTKYSVPLDAKYQEGRETFPIQMGCYGIGVSRLIAAIVEASHDARGIVWPSAVAPYTVCVVPVPKKKADIQQQINEGVAKACAELSKAVGMENVILDDREGLTPGFKLKDCELVGYPFVLLVGKSYLKEGKVELECRRNKEKRFVTVEELGACFEGVEVVR
ncbi:hypothetical protein HDV00_003187 [Rhizophlyctis rosea]|nr:hypothetical protein HDV00_003187 [Rhizophlyctis rosea]